MSASCGKTWSSKCWHENCRMGQKTPHHHLSHHWTMPLTPQLFQHQPCLPAAPQKKMKTAHLPMASTYQMARLSRTMMASDASMSDDQLPTPMPALDQGRQSTNSQMTPSGVLCLPPTLLSRVCGGIIEGEGPAVDQPSSAMTCTNVEIHAYRSACVVPAQHASVQVTVFGVLGMCMGSKSSAAWPASMLTVKGPHSGPPGRRFFVDDHPLCLFVSIPCAYPTHDPDAN